MKKSTKYCWVVLAVVWLASGIGSYAQYQLTVFAPSLMADMGMSASQFSSLFTSPMIPAILFSIAGGMLADRIGAKRVVFVGILLGILGSVLRIGANDYSMLFIAMLLTGFAPTFVSTTSSKVLGSWFAPEKLVLVMGLFSTSGTLLGALASSTTAFFANQKIAYTVAAVGFVVTAVLWLFFMKESPNAADSSKVQAQASGDGAVSVKAQLKIVLGNKTIWKACICIMAIVGSTIALSSFMATALASYHGFDMALAGSIAAMISLGNMFGALAGPVICRKVSTRSFLCGAALISAVCAALVWKIPSVPFLYVGMIFTGIVLGSPMPLILSMPMMIPEIGARYAGCAGGTIATMQLIGAVVIPTYILTPITGDNYSLLFLLAGCCMLLVFVTGLFMPDFSTKE